MLPRTESLTFLLLLKIWIIQVWSQKSLHEETTQFLQLQPETTGSQKVMMILQVLVQRSPKHQDPYIRQNLAPSLLMNWMTFCLTNQRNSWARNGVAELSVQYQELIFKRHVSNETRGMMIFRVKRERIWAMFLTISATEHWMMITAM